MFCIDKGLVSEVVGGWQVLGFLVQDEAVNFVAVIEVVIRGKWTNCIVTQVANHRSVDLLTVSLIPHYPPCLGNSSRLASWNNICTVQGSRVLGRKLDELLSSEVFELTPSQRSRVYNSIDLKELRLER